MHSDLDISGGLTLRKYPPFPLATDLSTGSVGVSSGEER